MNDYSRKILITGGNGQIAQALRQHAFASQFDLIPLSHDQMDITSIRSIKNAIDRYTPDTVVNTAAYTAVDKAEQDAATAFSVNHTGAEHLAAACQQQEIPLIHLSTDYVFDGMKQSPYLESDETHPINIYGQSKLLGEQAIREQCAQHIILRVSGVFSEFGHNFLKTMVKLAKEKKELRIVGDQVTCPTYAGDIANAIYTMIKHPIKAGTYHFSSGEPVSWHDFAVAIIAEAETHTPVIVESIKSITTAEYPTPAQRPTYSVLSCEKIHGALGLLPPSWIAGIRASIRAMLHIKC